MPSLRTIVAATDFSAFSERVVQRAAHIARQHDADFRLRALTEFHGNANL